MKRTYLVLIITMLVIGFAAVSANLVLSGTLKIGFNSEEFEKGVIFTNASPINGTASIQENNKAINYTTNKLDNIGEESTLDYAVTNKSNQYDADVTINCSLNNDSSTYSDYIDLTQDLNTKFTLSAGTTKKGRVTVKLKKSYVTNDNTQIEFTCTIVATAKEKEEIVEYQPETIYTETALNGADPVLEGDSISTVSLEEKEEKKLIPVIINEDATVTYADITKKWYDYENQEWANAVILSNYNHIPKVGEEIPEENIESYFVWIPKYRYKLFDENMGNYSKIEEGTDLESKAQEIEIEFGIDNTVDDEGNQECATPMLSGESGTCQKDYWMTHPAFLAFKNSKGFWVGKFETGYNQNTETTNVILNSNWTKEGAEKNITDASKIIIKPNVYSWRNISVGNAYKTSFQYQRILESHLMKSTEWGAVAYLSHSKYGTCNGNKCTEIRINNSSSYVTGVAAINEPDTGLPNYKDHKVTIPKQDNDKSKVYPNSGNASTTVNNTGIFDMAGGSWEYVAGVLTDASNTKDLKVENIQFSKSELTISDILDKKYIDLYKSGTDLEYDRRILGDATGEMGPFTKKTYGSGERRISSWYSDEGWFINGVSSWFNPSGDAQTGIGAGIFNFGYESGRALYQHSFRIVLSPQ